VNPKGLVLVLLGVWVGCQVFGGEGLERLKVIS